MSCICIAIIVVYLLFLPPSYYPVDPATAVDTPVIDYVVDDSALATGLPGKQCPFPSPRYRLSFYIILALGIAAVATIIPILLHSLFLSPVIDTLLLSYAA